MPEHRQKRLKSGGTVIGIMRVAGNHMDQTGAKQMDAGSACTFTKTTENTAFVDLNDVTSSKPPGDQRRIMLYGRIAFRMCNNRNQ